ncbi:MAG TPA: Crp/Fnr family transcriptional regulator [Spirochaetia bacterium]|nr:Crp/Fnr family transcriptional regulator [Spirochaetia bacterium]
MIDRGVALSAFPFLDSVPSASREQFLSQAIAKRLEPDQILVSGGSECAYLPLVLEGTLRVYKVSSEGRELTLYRIERGESCVLTATCIMNHDGFPAIARAEGPTLVALLPARLLSGLVEKHPAWRAFVFGLYARRLDSMLALVEEVAFRHVDQRIAGYLLSAPSRVGAVRTTHARIALEIGTSREVVSRILKDFESRGILRVSRGAVLILLPEELARYQSSTA